MRRTKIGIVAAATLSLLLSVATPSTAQNTSALINQALDRPLNLDIKDVTIPGLLDKIKAETGIPFRVDPAVWELLPWGEQTVLTMVKIDNQLLRQTLDAVTRPLGLTYVLQDEALELRPLPALRRLGRRATQNELKALEVLSSTPLAHPGDRATVQQLLTLIDQKLLDTRSTFAIENRAGEALKPDQVVPVARNATLADALDALTVSTPTTWYPWGKSVVILTKPDQVRNLLQSKTVSLRYDGVDLSQVLMELSQHAGVDFDVQPGAIQTVPQEFRTIRLLFDNVNVKQALDALAGFTGLSWTANDKGVYVWNASATGGAGPAAPRDPAVGLIQLDNGVQLILPQSQIPPDVREYLRHRANREIAKLRQMMNEEGFKPSPASTQPAPPPATLPSAPAEPRDERL